MTNPSLREFTLADDPAFLLSSSEPSPELESQWEEDLHAQEIEEERDQDDREEEEREQFDWWGQEGETVKKNPMHHRDRVYLDMLAHFCGDDKVFMRYRGRDSEQVRIAKQHGWGQKDVQRKIRLLLDILDFQFSEPGIYTQFWYENAGDPYPPLSGGDFTLDEESWSPLSDLQKVMDSCPSPMPDYQDDEQYKGVIADRMPGWSDIEQAWLGDSNSSDNCIFRPYNWIRHWIVTGTNDPPILIDPHYIMHKRGTPLPPLGELVRGGLEFSKGWRTWNPVHS